MTSSVKQNKPESENTVCCYYCKKKKDKATFQKGEGKLYKTCEDCRANSLIYYHKNREKILEKNKETFICSCGQTIEVQCRLGHELRNSSHKEYICLKYGKIFEKDEYLEILKKERKERMEKKEKKIATEFKKKDENIFQCA
jgi:dTDP-4-dehydrorhamnose 3,5-epimerase-like enzyme